MGHQLLEAGHIDVAHRLMTDPNSNIIPPIIVKFNTRTNRDAFYSHRSVLKNFTIADMQLEQTPATLKMENKIYINKSLSSVDTKLLFRRAREHAKAAHYKQCYTFGGLIYLKNDMVAPRI